MEPRDLELEDALRLFASADPYSAKGHHIYEHFFYEYSGGRHVALADGHVRFISHGVDRETWSALLTIEDGSPADDWTTTGNTASRLRVGNCCRLAIFVVLALFPLPWVWLNPRPVSADS